MFPKQNLVQHLLQASKYTSSSPAAAASTTQGISVCANALIGVVCVSVSVDMFCLQLQNKFTLPSLQHGEPVCVCLHK